MIFGAFGELNGNESLMMTMGIVVLLFGIYRLIILFSKRNSYNFENNETDRD